MQAENKEILRVFRNSDAFQGYSYVWLNYKYDKDQVCILIDIPQIRWRCRDMLEHTNMTFFKEVRETFFLYPVTRRRVSPVIFGKNITD